MAESDLKPLTPFGELLRRLRRAQGLSLYELANRCGLNRSTLMRWEDGTSEPTADALGKLARALDVDVEEFYDAVWSGTKGPLPSPAVYFRSKYHLDDAQLAELQAAVERITEQDNKNVKNERRSP